jgi:hypothetical protein
MKSFKREFDRVNSFGELFELVKAVVRDSIGRERSGLMLGFTELGIHPQGFVGGFHPVGSNIIVMNKTAARLIAANKPELYKAYCFHILLHEYLHTMGFLDEMNTRTVAHLITKEAFGDDHPTAIVSSRFNEMLKDMSLDFRLMHVEDRGIHIIENFDSSNLSYIG